MSDAVKANIAGHEGEETGFVAKIVRKISV